MQYTVITGRTLEQYFQTMVMETGQYTLVGNFLSSVSSVVPSVLTPICWARLTTSAWLILSS